MKYTQIVRKLIGPIKPVGTSHIDDDRLENLKEMCNTVGELVADIQIVADCKDRHEHSVKEAGEFADTFIQWLSGQGNEK